MKNASVLLGLISASLVFVGCKQEAGSVASTAASAQPSSNEAKSTESPVVRELSEIARANPLRVPREARCSNGNAHDLKYQGVEFANRWCMWDDKDDPTGRATFYSKTLNDDRVPQFRGRIVEFNYGMAVSNPSDEMMSGAAVGFKKKYGGRCEGEGVRIACESLVRVAADGGVMNGVLYLTNKRMPFAYVPYLRFVNSELLDVAVRESLKRDAVSGEALMK